MDIHTIKVEAEYATATIFLLANNLCTNKLSDNVNYIIRIVDTKKEIFNDFRPIRLIHYKCFNKGKRFNLDKTITYIRKHQKKVFAVDFILYFVSEKETVILVELIKKDKKNDDQLHFHGKIILPPIYTMNEEKFDANWYYNETLKSLQLNTL